MGSIAPKQTDSAELTPRLYPPFPLGTEPVAHLDTFSLAKLQSNDSAEHARLFKTCQTQGFFYLDFIDTPMETLPQDAEVIRRLSEEVFKLPISEKMRYKLTSQKPNSILG